MRVDILTLFPAVCEGALGESMMRRARDAGLLDLHIHQLRDWAEGKHRVTDDMPYGGGQGMVMKPEPIFAAVEALRTPQSKVLMPSPQGRVFSQKLAAELSVETHLIFICGHYEGIDHRVTEHLVDQEISIGDYVLTNGALAAAVIVDASVRLIPGVLGDAQSAVEESFQHGMLDWPHYTRPAEFRGWKVPDVLLGGNHRAIAEWRQNEALRRTREQRPDLRRE